MTTVGGEIEPVSRPSSSVVVELVGVVALVLYSVTAAVSFAALVFTGPAADGLPRGASTFLLASGVITIALGVGTRLPLAFGVVQDTAAIVFVPAVAVIAANGSDDPVRDVFVALSVSSAITGAVLWAIGRARLAGAARFMPTTVVSGFLAGTGWLLTKGGFDVMTERSLGFGDLADLVDEDLAKFWLPGAGLGIVIAVVPLVRRLSPLVSSIATIAATFVFFGVVAAGSSIDAVERGGWVLGPFPDTGSIEFVAGDAAAADWSAVFSAGGEIGVVVILSLLGALLNISGIQTLLRRRTDLDTELRAVGLANIAVAPVGGLVGYHGLGDSALAERLGVRRRWAPFAVGSAMVVLAFTGASLLGFLPTFVAGGLLIGAGLGLLVDWIGDLRSTTTNSDRAVSVTILAVIAFVGILEGIVVGIVAACVFFVIRYSRIDAIRMVSTGAQRRSVVERSVGESRLLHDAADRLVVYELHGSLFFGSVARVASTVRERLATSELGPEVVVVDFARVADIDSSAFAALDELADDLDTAGVHLVWSQLPRGAEAVLARSGRILDVADVLDTALESAEDRLIAVGRRPDTAPLIRSSADRYPTDLLDLFEPRRHTSGDVFIREGEPSDELIVVISGSVRVSNLDDSGAEVRLRILRAEVTLGEIGFLTGGVRTATVAAETDVDVRVLGRETLARIRADRPDLLIELYERVLRTAADRAAAINSSLLDARR